MYIPSALDAFVAKPTAFVEVTEVLVNLEIATQTFEASLREANRSLSTSIAHSITPANGELRSLSFIEVAIRLNSSGIPAGTYELLLNITTTAKLDSIADDSRCPNCDVTESLSIDVPLRFVDQTRADVELSTVKVSGTPTLGEDWKTIHIFPVDADGFEIMSDTDAQFSVTLESNGDSNQATCEVAWYSSMRCYGVTCSMPVVLTVDITAGYWTLEVALDGEVFFTSVVQAKCPDLYFSDLTATCRQCMTGVSCIAGSHVSSLVLEAGYWRCCLDSYRVLPCGIEGACLGGNATHSCRLGTHGPLCSVCDPGYFMSREQDCERCDAIQIHRLSIIIVSALGGLILIAKLLPFVIPKCKASHELGRFLLKLMWNVYRVTKVKGLVLATTLQVINQYAAITSSSEGSASFPNVAMIFARGMDFLSFNFVAYIPPECVHTAATFYTTLVIKTVSPLIVIAIIWVVPAWKAMLGVEGADLGAASFRTLLFLELILPSVSTTICETLVSSIVGPCRPDPRHPSSTHSARRHGTLTGMRQI